MKKLLKDCLFKKVLPALAVAGLGFILLSVAFTFDSLFQSLVDSIVKLFTPVDVNMAWRWFPPVKHVLFIAIVGLISWRVFKSEADVFFKAVFMTLPLAMAFISLGMFLDKWPVAVYSLSVILFLIILYYFYRTKQPWLYYYILIVVGAVLAIFSLLGVEI